jgi:hypothetical protein
MAIRVGGSSKVMDADAASGNPELTEAARALASLAFDRWLQDGSLGLRQREQLRRALATAGQALGWESMPGTRAERTEAAIQDVARLADVGMNLLDQDLEELLAGKRREIQRIRNVAASVHDLATDSTVSYPTEVEYSHTVRNAGGELVTRISTLTLKDPAAALSAAATLENRLDGLAKLRDQMLEDLRQRRRQIKVMRHGLPGFADSSRRVVGELLALAT